MKISELNNILHAAIIMDGNGRWAEKHGQKRSFGHDEGAKVVREITETAAKIGIKYLTLYAFSTENWKRPKIEIDYLMRLFSRFLEKEFDNLMKNNIKFETIGDIEKFDKSLQNKIKKVKERTKDNSGMTQVLAVNYGSHDEIIRAYKKLAQKNLDITEENLEQNLDTKNFPPVDLLIRTGGEKRLSNFLLWQASYAELFFSNSLWPEFKKEEFENIVQEYKKITRKFGGV